MNRLLIAAILISLNGFTLHAQELVCRQAVSQVSVDSLYKWVRELSGRDSVIVSGEKVRIASRYATHPDNDVAASYLKEKCLGYGFTAEDIPYSATGRNIVMFKPGTVAPKTAYILCAHYDCVGNGTAAFEGADDNASGTAAVLEAARLLKDQSFPYTLVLAFWDEEEQGLIGSKAFAPDGPLGYWDVKGVINLDMIGYENTNDSLALIHTKPVNQSVLLAQKLVDLNTKLEINLQLQVKNPGETATDQQSFWLTGATAVGLTEDYDNDFNPNWHLFSDKLEALDSVYFTKVSQLAIGAICEIVSTGSVVGLPSVNQQLNGVELFPNPATQQVQIVLPENILNAEYTIRDLFGANLMSQSFNTQQTTIDLPLKEGIYFVEIRTNGESRTLKLALLNGQ